MNEKFAWYLSRSSGWVAFVLLALTAVWGVLGITRLIDRRGLPRWLMELHRHLALLAVAATAVHLLALVGDNYMHIAWREIFVPFAMDYRPGAVAWGVASLYVLVAVQLTSWARHRLPRRWWRGVHLTSYPLLWMVAIHGLQAGTDAGSPLVRWLVIGVVAVVSFVTFVRLFTVGPRRRRSDEVPVGTLLADVSDQPGSERAHTTDPAATHRHGARRVDHVDDVDGVRAR